MKIIFFGSDPFSIKALEACLHSAGIELTLVITTPAKKKGRGLKLEPSEVFDYCRAKTLPVVEYPTLRDPEVAQKLIALRPDIFVVASYGKLIPGNLLDIPKYRLNVHPSLLPKYRGAAPIHWPILNGDRETGVSIIDIAEKLDAGDIYYQEKIAIDPRANAATLSSELARFSYGVLKKVLAQLQNGQLHGTPQDESEATLAPQLSKKDGELSFVNMTAEEIDRKVRGLQPWPGAFCFLKEERLAILETDLPGLDTNEKPGTIVTLEKKSGMTVATKKGALAVLRVKPEGKKEMPAADFANGRRLRPGNIL
jgi:methionyl-tRNA formyltransferase